MAYWVDLFGIAYDMMTECLQFPWKIGAKEQLEKVEKV